MKKILFAITGSLFLVACEPTTAPQLSDADIQAKVDSVVTEKTDMLNQQANEDLDRRMAIEVKPKADSIVAAQ